MGRAKAWLPFGNECLLQRVVRLVKQSVGPVVVVAAPGQEVPVVPEGVTVVRDLVAGRGPLQGLAAGLAALPPEIEVAYATATDVPFLEPAWIGRLAELIGDHDLAIPRVEGYHHPLAALYRRKAVLTVIEQLLAENQLRAGLLMEKVRTRVVEADELRAIDPLFRTLRNLNSPEDYEQALAESGLARPQEGIGPAS